MTTQKYKFTHEKMKTNIEEEIYSYARVNLDTWIVSNVDEEYDEIDTLDKQQTKQFAKEVPDNIEFSKNFTDEDFEVCFMEFDKDGSGSIQKDEIFDLCKKLMSPDPCLGEYHFPEFSLFDIDEYLVRLANQTSTYGIRFNIWLTQE